MKVKLVYIIIISGLALFLGGMILLFKMQSLNNEETMRAPNQKILTKINTAELEELFSKKETAFLYVGRKSCPYCEKFQAKLINGLTKNGQKALYYDTDAARQRDENFISADKKLNIKTVPALIYIVNGRESARYRLDIFDQKEITKWLRVQ